ncbi:ribonuclease HII [Patescibacteria group bacterium]|nr:ribonuclease HII [Patescibacteria group bacterium]
MSKKNSSKPTFKEEEKLWKLGYKYVIGVDEVGRGSFAGPVTVGAVIFPVNFNSGFLNDINDSKVLSPNKRNEISPKIKSNLTYSISTVSIKTINKVGIGKATEIAFRRSIKRIIRIVNNGNANLGSNAINSRFFLLVDGFHIKYVKGIGLKKQKAIVKGDKKSLSIAAASIIAKVHRDKLMIKLAGAYPNYGLDVNKGYGTKAHREKIKKYGLSNIHRVSFNLSKFI